MTNKQMPNNLRECRKRVGLTMAEVAKRLGFKHYDRISRWEHGLMYPHLVNGINLAKIYGVTVEELYPELMHD